MRLCDIDPKILIAGGAAAISILALFIILFILFYQRRRHSFLREKQALENNLRNELLKTQLEAREQTFNLIGQEIHDNVGQLLSSTKLMMGLTERHLEVVPDPFKTAQETLKTAIIELRSLSKSLNKDWLHQFDLVENLQVEIERIKYAGDIKINWFGCTGKIQLSAESQVMLFRVIQEAVENAIKYRDAKKIAITLTCNDKINISIADTREQLQPASEPNGAGQTNMRRRIELLGGNIEWLSHAQQGTEVKITVPKQNMLT